MPSGFVGILTFDLHMPDGASLKGKRRHLLHTKAQLERRFGASVAEVDLHDLWQRARLTVACTGRAARDVEELLDGAERYLAGQEWELGRTQRQLVSLDD